jgi:glutamine synthetase type III
VRFDYAHVFYPLTNATAEKFESFVVFQITAGALPGTFHVMG